jgi:protocatechuate 3,4-dioxygenase beta subunit
VTTGRDAASVLAADHHSSESYTPATAESVIFAGNNSCVLSPEVTEGPYYVAGEYIRTNIAEDQAGVPLAMDVQVVDVTTCDPVPGAYLEIWRKLSLDTYITQPPRDRLIQQGRKKEEQMTDQQQRTTDCNSTGVYSGVSANGNGNSLTDKSNLNKTYNRGVQLTGSEGAVPFEPTFPGHYTGRTTHIHVMVHLNASAMANGTLMSTTASHVGQMFFDQSLITEVEATAVYNTNTQTLTTNAEDSIFSEEAATGDPVMEYVYLGDSVEDGLFAWLSFGIDTTVSKSVSAAAFLYENGGQANANSGLGGGPGGAGPSGSIPSGVSSTGAAAATSSVVTSGAAARRIRRVL